MKLTSDAYSLGRAATFAARHTSATGASPVLAGLRLTAEAAHIRLLGYNYEASSVVTADALVHEPGEVLVPGRVFAEVLRSLPPGEVEVIADDSAVSVRAGAVAARFPVLSLVDYPALPASPPTVGGVPAGQFTRATTQLARVAMRDDVVPVLSGAYLELTSQTLTAMASDRYRVAIRELAWDAPAIDDPRAAVVPAKPLADAAKAFDQRGTCRLGLSDEGDALFRLADDNQATTLRLIDGRYPPLRSKVPTQFIGAVTGSAEQLRTAIRRVCIVANKYAAVSLTIDEDGIELCPDGDVDTVVRERIPAKLDGTGATLSFNAGYLLDGLDALDTDDARLRFADGLRPALLTDAAATDPAPSQYVAMPRRHG